MIVRLKLFRWLLPILWLTLALPAAAQTNLTPPADLYLLLATGQVLRQDETSTVLTPDDIYVIDFGVNASGTRLAYRTEDGLYVRDLTSGAVRQVEGISADVPTYRGRGDTLVWSPAGDMLAYTTLYGARVAGDLDGTPVFTDLREGVFIQLSWSPSGRFLMGEIEGGVWWVYRRAGSTMQLTSVISSAVGTAWLSDPEIIFAPAEGGLRLMDLDNANRQSQLLDATVDYRLPFISADDALVFFGRSKNDATIPPGSGLLLRLARGSSAVQAAGQTPIALEGVRWVPGGTLLTIFQGGVLALIEPTNGQVFPLGQGGVVAYAWRERVIQRPTPTPPPAAATPTLFFLPTPTAAPAAEVMGLRLPRALFFMAEVNGRAQVWRLPPDGSPPTPITVSPAGVTEYVPAPDGRSVAYASAGELWVQPVSGQPRRVTRIAGFTEITPSISPDGSRIAYTEETAAEGGIWVAASDGTSDVRVLANGTDAARSRVYRRPQFSPDGAWLLVEVSNESGVTFGVFNIEARQVTVAPPPERNDLSAVNARWTSDGRVLIVRDATTGAMMDSGLYLYDALALGQSPAEWLPLPAGSVVHSVIEEQPGVWRALVAGSTSPDAPLQLVEIASGRLSPLGEIAPLIGARLSPDGSVAAGYEQVVTTETGERGRLAFLDVATGRRSVLSQPTQVWRVRWSN